MWHADEGLLSAYLDGELEGSSANRADATEIEAHLATCTECRALLEGVKRVRGRASDILASSGPMALEMPPFDELRARKEARSQRQQARQLNRTKVLAWAATIVLAAGVGWFARDAILTRNAVQLDAPGSPATVAIEAQDELSETFEQERDMDASADPGVATGGSASAPPTTLPAAGNESARQRLVLRQDVESRRAVTEGALASTQKGERTVAEPEMEEQIVSPFAADTGVLVRRQLDSVQRARESGLRAQFADAAPAGRAESVAALAPVLNRTTVDDRADASLRWDALKWNTLSAADAQAHWGGNPPRIDGIPVTNYSVATLSGGTAVRVTQLLDSASETLVEVISYRESDRAQQRRLAVPEAAQPGLVTSSIRSERSEERGDHTVVVRADVSPDSLVALLRRVVPRQD